MLYFAYGSNLDPEQLRERAPDARPVGLAALRDHRLIFPRYSPAWGGGVASVQALHGVTVWGLVMDVSEATLAELDRQEGFRGVGDQHNVYDREVMLVELTRPDDGSVPRRLRAYGYIARTSNPSPPSAAYRDAMVRGAVHHRLPEEYVAYLKTLPIAAPPSEG